MFECYVGDLYFYFLFIYNNEFNISKCFVDELVVKIKWFGLKVNILVSLVYEVFFFGIYI